MILLVKLLESCVPKISNVIKHILTKNQSVAKVVNIRSAFCCRMDGQAITAMSIRSVIDVQLILRSIAAIHSMYFFPNLRRMLIGLQKHDNIPANAC